MYYKLPNQRCYPASPAGLLAPPFIPAAWLTPVSDGHQTSAGNGRHSLYAIRDTIRYTAGDIRMATNAAGHLPVNAIRDTTRYAKLGISRMATIPLQSPDLNCQCPHGSIIQFKVT